MSASFACDVSAGTTPLPHFWEHTVGSGHAPLALRADWRSQMSRCHRELGFRRVRFHDLLSDQMGTLVRHENALLYSFFNADQIFDYLLSIGMKPFVELSFMPEALASGSTTVFHYRANVTPPKDYGQWGALVRKLVAHWVERYGTREVAEWFFEVWNEPNLPSFWTGTKEDYFELYRSAAEAIKGVDAALRVGGPAAARNEWIDEFLEFCEREGVPVDFVSTHHYPTDALGTEGTDTESQLAASPRGVLRAWAEETRRRARGLPVCYTEWNASSNPRDPLHDEPYAAAYIVKTVLEATGLVEAYSFWTFSDIFEENYFPSVPFHGGFGLLSLHGIAKPSYRAFELLHHLGNERLPVEGAHETVDAWAVRKGNDITVIVTNHALPRHAVSTEPVQIVLTAASSPRSACIERVDDDHANPKRLWRAMGEPEYPSAREIERLHEASRVRREPHALKYAGRTIELALDLPPHGVAALTVELDSGERLPR